MFSVFAIESQKLSWKFMRTRNAVGTQAIGERFHSFFRVSIPITGVYDP